MPKSSIKSRILSQLLDAYAATLKSRKSKLSAQTDSSALFLPPDDPGSLGDEAMLAAGMKYLANQGIKRIGIIGIKSNPDWKNLELVTDTIDLRGHFAGGGKDRFRFVHLVSSYDRFYCVGADVMDGFYSETRTLHFLNLVALAAKTGADTTILGFSFNEHPSLAAIQALANLPSNVRICCRDPISHKRLTQHLQRPVDLVADAAFLLHPAENSELVLRVSKWIGEQQLAGRVVIGINANSIHRQSLPEFGFDALIRLYSNTLTELFSANQKFSFLMIPHDFRGQESDVSLAQAILEALSLEMKLYCLQVPTPCSAAEVKSICADLDVVFTGRMHLAIACLGQGVPVAGITYQGKFEGLFNHFELQGMTIAPEEAFQPGVLTSFLLNLIARREQVRQQIQSNLAEVQTLSSSNFEKI